MSVDWAGYNSCKLCGHQYYRVKRLDFSGLCDACIDKNRREREGRANFHQLIEHADLLNQNGVTP